MNDVLKEKALRRTIAELNEKIKQKEKIIETIGITLTKMRDGIERLPLNFPFRDLRPFIMETLNLAIDAIEESESK